MRLFVKIPDASVICVEEEQFQVKNQVVDVPDSFGASLVSYPDYEVYIGQVELHEDFVAADEAATASALKEAKKAEKEAAAAAAKAAKEAVDLAKAEVARLEKEAADQEAARKAKEEADKLAAEEAAKLEAEKLASQNQNDKGNAAE